MRCRESPANASSTETVGPMDISKAGGDELSRNRLRSDQVTQRIACGVPFRFALGDRALNP